MSMGIFKVIVKDSSQSGQISTKQFFSIKKQEIIDYQEPLITWLCYTLMLKSMKNKENQNWQAQLKVIATLLLISKRLKKLASVKLITTLAQSFQKDYWAKKTLN